MTKNNQNPIKDGNQLPNYTIKKLYAKQIKHFML